MNKLRFHLEGVAEGSERDADWFEELTSEPILISLTRNGEVERPRLELAQDQLETLGWVDVARILSFSEGTVPQSTTSTLKAVFVCLGK